MFGPQSEVTMALPGFVGTVEGRDAMIVEFMEFCANARNLPTVPD